MRKIRGFRLALKPKEVARRARKASLDLPALGLSDEAALASFLGRLSDAAEPAVVFDSFPYDKAASPELSPVPGVAFTLSIATLGPDIEAPIAEASAGDARLAGLCDIAAGAFLEDAARFVLGLAEGEAAAERCGLGPLHYIAEPRALASAVARLAAGKIGVEAAEGALRPARSVAFSASWLAKAKGAARR